MLPAAQDLTTIGLNRTSLLRVTVRAFPTFSRS